MSTDKSVTVIGLGPMGRATVRTLLDAGYEVTVWNRSRLKVDQIAELGAIPADTVAEAVAASDIVLLSLIDYSAMYGVLGQVPDLAGKTVVNLSSDSPRAAGEGAAWVIERGAGFLTGAYMTQGDDIGHEASRLYLSGPPALYEAHRQVLGTLVPAVLHLGEDYGLAQVYYQAGLARFHAFLLSFEQSLAIIEAYGENVDRFVDLTTESLSDVDFMRAIAGAVAHGGMEDAAALSMMHAGSQHVIDTAEDVGVDADLTRTIQRYYTRALEETERTGSAVPVYQLLRGRAG